MDQIQSLSLSSEETATLLSTVAGASPHERALVEEEIARSHLPLARRLALRYRNRGIELDDLLQVANMALVKAIRRFEPDKGEFSHFASVTIAGELKRYFRDHGWTIRPPRAVQNLQIDIAAATAEWVQSHSAEPDVNELAGLLDADVDTVAEARIARDLFRLRSLDAPVGQTEGRTLSDTLTITDPHFDLVDAWVDLVRACQDLTDEDRQLIELRFYRELSQTQIADEIGVSQMQVSRRLSNLMTKLRGVIDQPAEAA